MELLRVEVSYIEPLKTGAESLAAESLPLEDRTHKRTVYVGVPAPYPDAYAKACEAAICHVVGADIGTALDKWTAWVRYVAHLGDPLVRSRAIEDVEGERLNQDRQWGGPEHDDTHSLGDWARFIWERLGKVTGSGARRALVQIAALSVAAIESIDRRDTP